MFISYCAPSHLRCGSLCGLFCRIQAAVLNRRMKQLLIGKEYCFCRAFVSSEKGTGWARFGANHLGEMGVLHTDSFLMLNLGVWPRP